MYVYKQSEQGLFTVGYYEPGTNNWIAERDYDQRGTAAARCNYLNGGAEEILKLQEALALLLEAFDALLPGAAHLAVDVGLLNDAACKARPLVTAANRGREIWHGK